MTDWHLVNLILPVVLPLAILGFVSGFHMSQAQQKRVSPWIAVKDGQLAWVALGMCLNALYELEHPTLPNIPHIWMSLTRWGMICLVILASLMAAFAPVLATPPNKPPGFWAGLWHFRVFWGSLLLTAGTAWLYGLIHLTTQS